ncbi:hypothetical protein HDU96_003232 [Phlyctochytrium bullatum]|nr:hypothetical protein HDU96_003232 [Phlyctochytrium bullatum]
MKIIYPPTISDGNPGNHPTGGELVPPDASEERDDNIFYREISEANSTVVRRWKKDLGGHLSAAWEAMQRVRIAPNMNHDTHLDDVMKFAHANERAMDAIGYGDFNKVKSETEGEEVEELVEEGEAPIPGGMAIDKFVADGDAPTLPVPQEEGGATFEPDVILYSVKLLGFASSSSRNGSYEFDDLTTESMVPFVEATSGEYRKPLPAFATEQVAKDISKRRNQAVDEIKSASLEWFKVSDEGVCFGPEILRVGDLVRIKGEHPPVAARIVRLRLKPPKVNHDLPSENAGVPSNPVSRSNKNMYACGLEGCNRTYKTQEECEDHRDAYVRQCDHCDFTCHRKQTLRDHIEAKHDGVSDADRGKTPAPTDLQLIKLEKPNGSPSQDIASSADRDEELRQQISALFEDMEYVHAASTSVAMCADGFASEGHANDSDEFWDESDDFMEDDDDDESAFTEEFADEATRDFVSQITTDNLNGQSPDRLIAEICAADPPTIFQTEILPSNSGIPDLSQQSDPPRDRCEKSEPQNQTQQADFATVPIERLYSESGIPDLPQHSEPAGEPFEESELLNQTVQTDSGGTALAAVVNGEEGNQQLQNLGVTDKVSRDAVLDLAETNVKVEELESSDSQAITKPFSAPPKSAITTDDEVIVIDSQDEAEITKSSNDGLQRRSSLGKSGDGRLASRSKSTTESSSQIGLKRGPASRTGSTSSSPVVDLTGRQKRPRFRFNPKETSKAAEVIVIDDDDCQIIAVNKPAKPPKFNDYEAIPIADPLQTPDLPVTNSTDQLQTPHLPVSNSTDPPVQTPDLPVSNSTPNDGEVQNLAASRAEKDTSMRVDIDLEHLSPLTESDSYEEVVRPTFPLNLPKDCPPQDLGDTMVVKEEEAEPLAPTQPIASGVPSSDSDMSLDDVNDPISTLSVLATQETMSHPQPTPQIPAAFSSSGSDMSIISSDESPSIAHGNSQAPEYLRVGSQTGDAVQVRPDGIATLDRSMGAIRSSGSGQHIPPATLQRQSQSVAFAVTIPAGSSTAIDPPTSQESMDVCGPEEAAQEEELTEQEWAIVMRYYGDRDVEQIERRIRFPENAQSA